MYKTEYAKTNYSNCEFCKLEIEMGALKIANLIEVFTF